MSKFQTCYDAAVENDFESLKKLHQEGKSIERECGIHAIRLNNIHMLNYIIKDQIKNFQSKEQRQELREQFITTSYMYTLESADEGNVKCLRILYKAGYKLHPNIIYKILDTIDHRTNSKLNCFKFIYEHINSSNRNFFMIEDDDLIEPVSELNNIKLVRYLSRQGVNFKLDETIETAAFSGKTSVPFLQYLVSLGCPISIEAVQTSICVSKFSKNLSNFKYLYSCLTKKKQQAVWTYHFDYKESEHFIRRARLDSLPRHFLETILLIINQ